jgi:hypothetical protein
VNPVQFDAGTIVEIAGWDVWGWFEPAVLPAVVVGVDPCHRGVFDASVGDGPFVVYGRRVIISMYRHFRWMPQSLRATKRFDECHRPVDRPASRVWIRLNDVVLHLVTKPPGVHEGHGLHMGIAGCLDSANARQSSQLRRRDNSLQ